MPTLSDKIEQVRMIKKGKGIEYLMDEAYKILGNPLVMFDTDYNLISHNEGIVTDDPMWNEITVRGTFSNEKQMLFKEEGFIDAVANAKVIAFLSSDRIKYDRISGKIFNRNNTHVANLVVMESSRPFNPDDTVIFEAVCELFSNEISTNEFYQNYEKTHQEALIIKLIDGSIINKELYSAHIAILYDGLKTNLYAAVADVSQCDPAYAKLTDFKDLFRHIQPEFKYSLYDDYIVIIMSSDNTTLDIKKDLNKFNRLFKKKNIHAGISGCFENIYELAKYYSDAVKALKFGLAGGSTQRIFLYDATNPDS